MDKNILTQQTYDLLIIGGGINGAGIAHLAQKNGHQVVLLEKSDFASGTSSKSTKLMHGGIRYLENFDFALVAEALKERTTQLEAARHLVKPLPFIIPVYSGDKRPLWLMKLGVFLYDLLAGKYGIKPHRQLAVSEICELVPGIKTDGLMGGVLYYDAQMDDARICLENLLVAKEEGAHLANYTEVTDFLKENGRVIGVRAKNSFSGDEFEVKAKTIICTVGPWTNHFLKKDQKNSKKEIRTTKGVHLVYKGQLSDHALLLPSDRDGRIFFVIPWHGQSLIGTTDTNYVRSPDMVRPFQTDIQYLIENTRRIFPKKDFSEENIITSFAGLRPLVRKRGNPSKVSRRHAIRQTESGLFFVTGGKYTTYRKIAADVLKKVYQKRIRGIFRLYGGGVITEDPKTLARQYDLEEASLKHIMELYGSRYHAILKIVKQDPVMRERLCECSPAILAQVQYSRDQEMAKTAEDVLERRLGLMYQPCSTKACCRKILDFFQKKSPD